MKLSRARPGAPLARAARLSLAVWLLILAGLVPALLSPRVPAQAQSALDLQLTPLIVAGLNDPVAITHAGDSRLFIVERCGRIRIFKNNSLLAAPFLNISSTGNNNRVRCSGSEEGLLSVAFAPGYATNGRFYVYYVNSGGDLVIARYRVSADPDLADVNSEQIVLTIPHPGQSNHNGGQLAFGPNDGLLYIGPGDGGGGGDPNNNAQNPAQLLGKLLRLDVETGNPPTYTIPANNPFVQASGYRGEIWALGLRNPWRFSFDRTTGELYIGDVGQGAWEEIDHQPANSAGGQNYGWRCFEGNADYNTNGCGPRSNYTFPVWVYGRGLGCSVTGGYVYRGALYPNLTGRYLYSDYCSGRIWSLRNTGAAWENVELLDSDVSVSAFGEDAGGELYVAGLGDDSIHRLVDAGAATATPTRTASPTATPTPTATRTATPNEFALSYGHAHSDGNTHSNGYAHADGGDSDGLANCIADQIANAGRYGFTDQHAHRNADPAAVRHGDRHLFTNGLAACFNSDADRDGDADSLADTHHAAQRHAAARAGLSNLPARDCEALAFPSPAGRGAGGEGRQA